MLTFDDDDADIASLSGRIGIARVDADFTIVSRLGRLSEWLPDTGYSCGDNPVLSGLATMFDELRTGARSEIVLPSLRAPESSEARRLTISIVWNARRKNFVILTTIDASGEETERLLATGRRERELLRQQAEAATRRLHAHEALYRDIVESGGDIVLRLSADLRITFANRRAFMVCAAERQPHAGRHVAEAFPAGTNAPSWRVDMCAGGPASFEQSLETPGGARVWLAWSVHWLGASGGPSEFQAVGHDVTLLRALRAQASEQARAGAVVRERLRIARDLHDTLLQSQMAVLLELRNLRRRMSEPGMIAEATRIESLTRDSIAQTRSAIADIRLDPVWGAGLADVVESLVSRLQTHTNCRVDVRIDADVWSGAAAISGPVTRILEEAFRNIERHARATHVVLSMHMQGSTLHLRLADDGVGFDVEASRPGHFGIEGMREQAQDIGGRLTIASRPGGASELRLEVDLAAANPIPPEPA